MSGTRVITMSAPLIAPSTRPISSTKAPPRFANSSLLPSMRVAAVTLVSAIIEAIDRSTPPAITTIAWPAAAKAKGSAARTSEPKPAAP